jgi:hypothetical protein
MCISELVKLLQDIEFRMGDVVVECGDGSELGTNDVFEDNENGVLVIA